MIKKLTGENCRRTSHIHYESMPNEFLPCLGERFLYILHSYLLDSSFAIGLGHFREKNLTGFIICSTDTKKAMRTVFAKGFFKIIPIIIKKILQDPKIILYLFQTILYGKKDANFAEILVLAVDKNERKKGKGTKLILALKNELRKLGVKQFKVGTLSTNMAANRLYQKFGTFKYSFRLYGKKWNTYYIKTT